jgi:hypothetical protein
LPWNGLWSNRPSAARMEPPGRPWLS